MKLLLSNDDGVMAPGLRSLYEKLAPLHETTIIAPLEERSTTGHSLSLDRPLRLEKIEKDIYGCSGFPGDCVLIGLGHVLKNNRPDLVISGINRGANLGQDLYYSGTIAAAREATFHQVPALAVSLVFNAVNEEHRYLSAATIAQWFIESKVHQYCPPFTLININVPNLPVSEIKGVRLTEIGFRKYSEDIYARSDARGREYFWIAGHYQGYENNPHSDCHALEEGFVAITPHPLIDRIDRDYRSLKDSVEKMNETYFS